MEKLTQEERDLIFRAAEIVDQKPFSWSCNVLKVELGASQELVTKYADFYDRHDLAAWHCGELGKSDFSVMDASCKEWRVMCLLNFAEVG